MTGRALGGPLGGYWGHWKGTGWHGEGEEVTLGGEVEMALGRAGGGDTGGGRGEVTLTCQQCRCHQHDPELHGGT